MASLHFVCPVCMAEHGTFTVEGDSQEGVVLRCDNCGSQIYADELDEVVVEGRGRAERRRNNVKKALRKREITQHVYYGGDKFPYYNNLHQYSKNKIHCSCPLCANKSNPAKGGKNWSPADRRKMAGAASQVEDYLTSDLSELLMVVS